MSAPKNWELNKDTEYIKEYVLEGDFGVRVQVREWDGDKKYQLIRHVFTVHEGVPEVFFQIAVGDNKAELKSEATEFIREHPHGLVHWEEEDSGRLNNGDMSLRTQGVLGEGYYNVKVTDDYEIVTEFGRFRSRETAQRQARFVARLAPNGDVMSVIEQMGYEQHD